MKGCYLIVQVFRRDVGLKIIFLKFVIKSDIFDEVQIYEVYKFFYVILDIMIDGFEIKLEYFVFNFVGCIVFR